MRHCLFAAAALAALLSSCSDSPQSRPTKQSIQTTSRAVPDLDGKDLEALARADKERLERERQLQKVAEENRRRENEARHKQEEKDAAEAARKQAEARDKEILREIALMPGLEATTMSAAYKQLKEGRFRLEDWKGFQREALRKHAHLVMNDDLRKQFLAESRADRKDNDFIDSLSLRGSKKEDGVRLELRLVEHTKIDAVYEMAEHVKRIGGMKNVARLSDPVKDIIRTHRELFVDP